MFKIYQITLTKILPSSFLKGVFLVSLLCSCSKDPAIFVPEFQVEIPKGFPKIIYPDDNKPTQARIDLGKKLFSDPILSLDSTISCQSCHARDKSFSNGTKFSLGVFDSIGFRNAMQLANVAYNTSFFWDGGVPTLELQVVAPITSPFEMQESMENVVAKLQRHKDYPALFRAAYGRNPDQFSITRAIAAFERTLLSGNSTYDRFLVDSTVFSKSQLNGKNLFMSERTNCSKCHAGFNFTNNFFSNNGIAKVYTDPGRQRVTFSATDFHKFKVPSLRNVQFSAPYMHNGSFNSLQEVVENYARGGSGHPNQSSIIKPLNLSEAEKEDLLNFLYSLTDSSFLGLK